MGLIAVGKPDHVFPNGPEICVGLGLDLQVSQRYVADLPFFPDLGQYAPVNVFFRQFQHVHLVAEPERSLGHAGGEVGVPRLPHG